MSGKFLFFSAEDRLNIKMEDSPSCRLIAPHLVLLLKTNDNDKIYETTESLVVHVLNTNMEEAGFMICSQPALLYKVWLKIVKKYVDF